MLITTIDMAKGESFKTCTWIKATKEEEYKIMSIMKKYKQ